MDATQLAHERAVGDKLVEWLNERDGTSFAFSHREREAPDLVFRDEEALVRVEVVGAYYDESDAKLLWKTARGQPDAPGGWAGTNFDAALLRNVQLQIEKKCGKAYGPGCLLLITVHPALTTAAIMQDLLDRIVLPAIMPFAGVFLAGEFPGGVASRSGYHAWELSDRGG